MILVSAQAYFLLRPRNDAHNFNFLRCFEKLFKHVYVIEFPERGLSHTYYIYSIKVEPIKKLGTSEFSETMITKTISKKEPENFER